MTSFCSIAAPDCRTGQRVDIACAQLPSLSLLLNIYLFAIANWQKHFEPIVQGCSSYIQPLVSGYKDCCWMGCWKRKRWTDYENSMCSGYYILDQGSYFRVNTLSCTILSFIELKLDAFCLEYRKVVSSSLSWSVAYFQIFRRLMMGEIWCLCTVTFGQKVPKLNSRLVYCSQLYGM